MRLRAGAATLFLSLTLPALLTEAGVGFVPLAEPTAAAQDAVTEVARQRYEEGVKAFDAGRFEDARSAFLQAYALKRHPAVLLNLGQSELKSGHAEDAGNHLQQFLREFPSATPDQRASAERGISEAKKKTAFLIPIVDASGADVSVDGVAIGKAPVLDPYFLKPGNHTVLATYQGKSATVTIDAKSGVATAANLILGTTGTAAPIVVPPAPTPTPAQPVAQPLGPATQQPPPGYPPPDQYAPPQDQGGFQMSTQDTSSREPILHWYKRKPLAWVGTGVAALGLLNGIIFSVAAGSAASSADDHTKQINDYSSAQLAAINDRTDLTETQREALRQEHSMPVCGDIEGGGDKTAYTKACDALRSDFSDHDTDVALATVGWVFFGLGVAGTTAYALVDWYPKKNEPQTGGFIIAPIVSPTQRGIGILGSF